MIDRPEGIVITMPVKFLQDLSYGILRKRIIDHLGVRSTYTEDFLRAKVNHNWRRKIQISVGIKEYLRQMELVQKDEDSYWMHKISAIPTIDVLYAYITVLGKIRYRANIGGFEKGGTRTFQDGRDCTAKHWMILTHPFIKAPEGIPFKGCQGFRYCEKYF